MADEDSYDLEPKPQPTEPSTPENASAPLEPEPIEPEAPRPELKAAPKSEATTTMPAAPLRPLVRTNRVEWPLAVAGCALALYIAGCIAGQLGVTPNIPDPNAVAASGVTPLVTEATALIPQELGARMIVAMKGLLRVGVLGMCLVAGAYFLQLLDRRPIGDVRALLARTIAISALALLVMFMPFESLMLKRFYDVLVPLGVVWLVMIPFFRISPRDSGVILLGALMALTVLSLGSLIVGFAVG